MRSGITDAALDAGSADSPSLFQFTPKVIDAIEVRALCKSVKYFHTPLSQPCLSGRAWSTAILEQKRPCLKVVYSTSI